MHRRRSALFILHFCFLLLPFASHAFAATDFYRLLGTLTFFVNNKSEMIEETHEGACNIFPNLQMLALEDGVDFIVRAIFKNHSPKIGSDMLQKYFAGLKHAKFQYFDEKPDIRLVEVQCADTNFLGIVTYVNDAANLQHLLLVAANLRSQAFWAQYRFLPAPKKTLSFGACFGACMCVSALLFVVMACVSVFRIKRGLKVA